MAAYASIAQMDLAFWAWYRRVGQRSDRVVWALERTKQQIGGAMDPGYIAPPWRTAPSGPPLPSPFQGPPDPEPEGYENQGPPEPTNQDDPKRTMAQKAEMDAQREKVLEARRFAIWHLLWVRDIVSVPPAAFEELMEISHRTYPGKIGPTLRWSDISNVIERYRRHIRFRNSASIPPPPSGQMSVQQWLEALQFMASSPLGAPIYHINRRAGASHKTALGVAKQFAASLGALGHAGAGINPNKLANPQPSYRGYWGHKPATRLQPGHRAPQH